MGRMKRQRELDTDGEHLRQRRNTEMKRITPERERKKKRRIKSSEKNKRI